MTRFAEIFADRPVLADGAMGTVLYARGVFINRCYDELNLSDPNLILAVHEEYLQAGAEILETNTFGANRFRLTRHGLGGKGGGDQYGWRAAGAAGSGETEGAAGRARPGLREQWDRWACGWSLWARRVWMRHARPLPNRSALWRKTASTLLIVETMPALNEAREALEAAKAVAPDLPVLVMVTVDDESECLDGSSPAQAAALLTEWGAGAVGVNCSTGPATVLTAIEQMRSATALPLAAMPNAGMPRAVDGRNIYLCSPEYMASFARKAIAAGAQIVGGCCGTTPNHIRAMRLGRFGQSTSKRTLR